MHLRDVLGHVLSDFDIFEKKIAGTEQTFTIIVQIAAAWTTHGAAEQCLQRDVKFVSMCLQVLVTQHVCM